MLFRDRSDAGRQLSEKLFKYTNRPDVVVLALPRGGVPVAYEVARALNAPLDVFLVRKLGLPGHEELAVGAIASGGVRVLNEKVIERFHVPVQTIQEVAEREERELARRESAYRGTAPPVEVRGKTAVLVDDGLATGASMRAAVIALRPRRPSRIVVAVPIGPPDTCRDLEALALVDEVVCGATPEPFSAVGQWYEDFLQTSDEEVRELLALARTRARARASKKKTGPGAGASSRSVRNGPAERPELRLSKEEGMPEQETLERARKEKREGKAPSTQAGEFVREEIEHIREGKHGIDQTGHCDRTLQGPPRGGPAEAPAKGGSPERDPKERPAGLREGKEERRQAIWEASRAASKALRREGHEAASRASLSRQARQAARKGK